MMRQKKEQLVITFPTTTEAMKMEEYCQKEGLFGRIIPLPSEISAGCGLAWKTEQELETLFSEKLEQAGITWDSMAILML